MARFPVRFQLAVIKLQIVRCDAKRHLFGFARLQADFLESPQFFHAACEAGHRLAQIQLHIFFARPFTRVRHSNRSKQGLVTGEVCFAEFDVAKGKRGIAQAVSKGELRLAAEEPDESRAEASFVKAIEIAGDQGAKSFELRAAASLAGLWRDQGRRVEARDLLAPVYSWFTEGFDTLDLKEAKLLLDELR